MTSVHLLADRPELIEPVGLLRWREWGRAPEPADPAFWVEATRRESGRDELPVTFVAVDGAGDPVGALGLGAYDIAERRDRTPWLLGVVVRPDRRGSGVGRLLLSHVERCAVDLGHARMWVATGGPAVAFYERCAWRVTERVRQASGEVATVLMRELQRSDGPAGGLPARPEGRPGF
jgi:GNAT superfamily N-acetyltransferase